MKKESNYPEYGQKVKSLLECPVCGSARRINARWGNRFTKCKMCGSKLFNAAAGERLGQTDDRGNYYRINCVFQDLDGNDDFDSLGMLRAMKEAESLEKSLQPGRKRAFEIRKRVL